MLTFENKTSNFPDSLLSFWTGRYICFFLKFTNMWSLAQENSESDLANYSSLRMKLKIIFFILVSFSTLPTFKNEGFPPVKIPTSNLWREFYSICDICMVIWSHNIFKFITLSRKAWTMKQMHKQGLLNRQVLRLWYLIWEEENPHWRSWPTSSKCILVGFIFLFFQVLKQLASFSKSLSHALSESFNSFIHTGFW